MKTFYTKLEFIRDFCHKVPLSLFSLVFRPLYQYHIHVITYPHWSFPITALQSLLKSLITEKFLKTNMEHTNTFWDKWKICSSPDTSWEQRGKQAEEGIWKIYLYPLVHGTRTVKSLRKIRKNYDLIAPKCKKHK